MNQLRRTLLVRAADQRGLLSRSDLADVGVTDSQLWRLQQDGTLIRMGKRVFRAGGVSLDGRSRLLAACLDVGGVASHRSAAWLHGLRGFGTCPGPEVVRQGGNAHLRSPLAVVHHTTWLPDDDVSSAEGIPCTSVARTLFALAGLVPELTHDQVRGAVDDAVRLGQASDKWLWWRLEKLRCRGRAGVAIFEDILVARAKQGPTESWLERELLRLLDEAGLPVPVCQARIARRGAFLARVDFLYPDARVIIEVSGAVAHASAAQRAADARRRNALLSMGYLVLEFTYEQVVGTPAAVIAQIRTALAARQVA